MAHAEKRDGKLTGRWMGEVDLRHKGGPRFRHAFESKRLAVGYEAYVRATGEEPSGLDGEASGLTFKAVAKELKAAGGPGGVWARGKDDSVIERLQFVMDSKIGKMVITKVTYAVCEEFVALLRKRPGKAKGSKLSARTVNRYLTAISTVMTYAETKAYVPTAPKLPWQKEVKKRGRKTTEAQDRAIHGCLLSEGWKAEAFIFDVLGVTGFRWGELESLRPDQIEDEWVTLDDPDDIKNEEPRVAYIGQVMARELRAMVAAKALPKYDTMRKRLKLALKTCGYESSRPIHTIRHTTCSRVVANEKNLPLAQRLLGHKSIQTTMGYVHHDREALREAAKNLSPQRGELPQEPQTSDLVEFKRKA